MQHKKLKTKNLLHLILKLNLQITVHQKQLISFFTAFIGACGVVKLTGNKNKYFKACFWLGGFWVVLWTLITLITNIACK